MRIFLSKQFNDITRNQAESQLDALPVACKGSSVEGSFPPSFGVFFLFLLLGSAGTKLLDIAACSTKTFSTPAPSTSLAPPG